MTPEPLPVPLFQTSRRRSHLVVVGILVVLGYFGAATLLIRDYSTAHAPAQVQPLA